MVVGFFQTLFYEIVLPNSAAGALFILFILLFRRVTKYLSKGYIRVLWILLLIELLAPPLLHGSFRTIRNLAQSVQIVRDNSSVRHSEGISPAAQEDGSSEKASAENALAAAIQQNKSDLDTQTQKRKGSQHDLSHLRQGYAVNAYADETLRILRTAVAAIWLLGVAGFFTVYLYQFLRLKRSVADAVYQKEDGYWVTEKTLTPFVMPLVMPRIYMPVGMTEQKQNDILAHERQHIKNMDHLIKCLAAFAAAVHWFNPFVWTAYELIGKDLEMYCDECVLRGRSMEERKQYSYSLLQFASESSGLSVMLHFGESDTENRIRHILFSKKPRIFVSIVLIIVMAVCGMFFLTSKSAEGKEEDRSLSTKENDNSPSAKEDKGGLPVGQDTREALESSIKAQTDDPLRSTYYADYDGDGSFELFAVTGEEPAGGTNQIWFASAQEVTCLIDHDQGYAAFNEEDEGICEVGSGQKLFVADCGTMGSTYFSKCYYVQSGKAYEADTGEHILEQTKGDDFKVYVDAYDRMYLDGALSGHTRKPYYAKWTGTGFKEYKAKRITIEQLAEYDGAWDVLSQLDQLYYVVAGIYQRKNGLIQINAVNIADDDSALFENVTLAVEGSSVSVVDAGDAEGLLEKSSYGGIYQESGIFAAGEENDTQTDLLAEVEQAQELRQIMTDFSQAYFAGNTAAVREFLAQSYASEVEVYDHPEQADDLEAGRIKGIGKMLEGDDLDECTLSLEFRVPGEDSYTYLSVWFVKEDGAWKAASYGLEK